MRIAALVYADLEADYFGAPSMLREDLLGRPPLAHTLARLAEVDSLDAIVLGAPSEQLAQAVQLGQVEKLRREVVLMPHRRPESQLWRSIRAARTFGRYGWRGGIAGTTVFDELFDITFIHAAAEKTSAGAVLLVSAGAALLDVDWVRELIEHYRQNADQCRAAFNQAPPGLSGGVFDANFLRNLATRKMYPGRTLGYDPERAGSSDPISEPYNRPVPPEVITTYRRFDASNLRGLWLCRKVMELAGPAAGGEAACRAAALVGPEPWPREITLELTTRRPVRDNLRGWCDRPDLSLDALRLATESLSEPKDINFMLAGGGDALLHPDWPAAARHLRTMGHVGIATYGKDLAASAEAMVAAGVEVVEVYLDAMSDAAYASHKQGPLSATEVWKEIQDFIANRNAMESPVPLLVPQMLKNLENIEEQMEFYQRTLATTGWSVIGEPSRLAGQWADHGVAHMAPPFRYPCRRIDTRLTLLSDGQVAACEEDLFAKAPLGRSNLLNFWCGEALAELRKLHQEGNWDSRPLCSGCEEFHRP